MLPLRLFPFVANTVIVIGSAVRCKGLQFGMRLFVVLGLAAGILPPGFSIENLRANAPEVADNFQNIGDEPATNSFESTPSGLHTHLAAPYTRQTIPGTSYPCRRAMPGTSNPRRRTVPGTSCPSSVPGNGLQRVFRQNEQPAGLDCWSSDTITPVKVIFVFLC
jgi:hypothetical protein